MKRASDVTRKQRLIRLHRMIEPETGHIIEGAFQSQRRLYEKSIRKSFVDAAITDCQACSLRDCPRACGWGDINARYLFVGQSLHEPGANSGVPFVLGSGLLIDAALRLMDMDRRDVFLTNAVHCHPPRNAPSTVDQLNACLKHLACEISIVEPEMILCLGNDAKGSMQRLPLQKTLLQLPSDNPPIIVYLPHPAAALRGSPEATTDWVMRCVREMDRI